MNHWLVVPVVLPAFAGPLIVLAMRHDLVLQRVFSTAATAAQLVLALARLAALAIRRFPLATSRKTRQTAYLSPF